MEWGLVANIAAPDLETRVAILQHKAELKGLKMPHKVAFFIAEHIYNNVRQLEGAINRLSAYCRMMQQEVTEDIAEQTLGEMFEETPKKSVTIDGILASVASMFNVKVSELRGTSRREKDCLPKASCYVSCKRDDERFFNESCLLFWWKNALNSDSCLEKSFKTSRN